jgi:hypothetical protein
VLDFAGGMVVHMLGGLFGLVGAYMCGPRLGRFELLAASDDDAGMEDGQVLSLCPGSHGSDVADSASELAGSNTPPSVQLGAVGLGQQAAGDAAAVQQQQLQADGPGSSRSLHTLLPSAPAAAGVSSSSSRGGAVELGQFKQPLRCGAAAAAADQPAGVAAGSSSMQSAAAGFSRAAQQQHALAGGAAGQAAADASSTSRGSWWFRLRQGLTPRRQQQRRQRQRRRPAMHDQDSTSAATCGSGVCTKFVPKAMPGHDMAFVTLGTFMLWFGWFGFNNGSVYMYVNGNPAPSPGSLAGAVSAEVVQRTSMNTALGGSAAGLTSLLCAALFWGKWPGCRALCMLYFHCGTRHASSWACCGSDLAAPVV